jgi:ferritin
MAITVLIPEQSLSIINKAIYSELDAFYSYQHLSIQCQRLGLFGAAKYFLNESSDELEHYRKHVDFLNDRGTACMLPNLEAADNTIEGLRNALTIAYDMELELGNNYSAWYTQALQSKDAITAQHLLQFLDIQRESIGKYSDWIQRLNIGGSMSIILIDQEMGA